MDDELNPDDYLFIGGATFMTPEEWMEFLDDEAQLNNSSRTYEQLRYLGLINDQ